MRLDDDLYRAAKSYALAEDCSISAAVNRLLLQKLENDVHRPRSGLKGCFTYKGKRRFPVSRGARPFGSKEVEAIENLDDSDQTP